MKTRKRLYELDFIKLIAMMAVFTVHFTVELQLNGVLAESQVFPTSIFHTYLGSFGVSLFFICSGAALMYVYGDECKLWPYLKKRFIGIFPMFWIAFLISTGFHMVLDRGLNESIPKWKIIFSILGIDGNALWWGPNFYQLGEWFLGVLICLYLVFPLIRIALNKKPLLTVIGILVIYVLCVLFFHSTLPTDCLFLTRLPEFLMGMLFIKYRDKFGWKLAIVGVLIVACITIIPEVYISSLIRVPLVGIGAFLALSFFFSKIKLFPIGKNLCEWGSRYSYPFFLTHHVIINFFAALFAGIVLRRSEVWMLYLCCLGVTLLLTKGLYAVNKGFLGLFKEKRRG